MKFILFDFRCEVCSNIFESMVKPDVFSAACPECGGESQRLISAPRLDPRLGLDPSFSTMSDKWARKHYQQRRIEDKRARRDGEPD